ncbi:Uncharacterized protein HZ326_29036 [Fusarium oxysporum f. sp. albedinis]|nr:Uncharacterized protein HZ326_29036 [Fusarium oxysporum f. sp. albedinis]
MLPLIKLAELSQIPSTVPGSLLRFKGPLSRPPLQALPQITLRRVPQGYRSLTKRWADSRLRAFMTTRTCPSMLLSLLLLLLLIIGPQGRGLRAGEDRRTPRMNCTRAR